MFRLPAQQGTPQRQNETFNMKQPKGPDRPLVPYMRYSRKMWPKVRAENPEAQLWDISKIIGVLWKEVPEAEKIIYHQEYEIERIEYEKAYKAYQNSVPYLNYMAAKAKSGKLAEKVSRSRMDTGGVVIQPVDEEEQSNELAARRLAAIRYDRNHRLIAELFGSTAVTDARAVTGAQRIEMLKKQAQSLRNHQSKLEEELQRLHENFLYKKSSIDKASEEFAQQLKQVCEDKPQVDDARYEEMIDEWKRKLANAYIHYKRTHQEAAAELEADPEKVPEKKPCLQASADPAKFKKELASRRIQRPREKLKDAMELESEKESPKSDETRKDESEGEKACEEAAFPDLETSGCDSEDRISGSEEGGPQDSEVKVSGSEERGLAEAEIKVTSSDEADQEEADARKAASEEAMQEDSQGKESLKGEKSLSEAGDKGMEVDESLKQESSLEGKEEKDTETGPQGNLTENFEEN